MSDCTHRCGSGIYDCAPCMSSQIDSLRAEVGRLREAVRFARCTIKGGEAWSQTCDSILAVTSPVIP